MLLESSGSDQDAAKQSTGHKTAHKQNYPASAVGNAEAEKPYFRHMRRLILMHK